jgi:hypothetical protein
VVVLKKIEEKKNAKSVSRIPKVNGKRIQPRSCAGNDVERFSENMVHRHGSSGEESILIDAR